MSHAALRLAGAGLEHAGPADGADDPSAGVEEARRLAELAGAFCLFGLDIAVRLAHVAPAPQPYRPSDATGPAPPNDAGTSAAPRFAFPSLNRRGIHLPPALPVRVLQAIDWLFVLTAAELAARWGAGVGLADLSVDGAGAIFAAAAAVKFGLWITGAYRVTPASMCAEHSLGGLALGVILGLGIAAISAPDARVAAALSATLPFAAMALAGIHAAIAVWTRAAHRAGVFSETIVLVGATEAAERVVERLTRSGEARVIAVADDRLARAPKVLGATPIGGSIDDLLAWDGLPNVDRVVVTVTQKAEKRVRDIIARLRAIPNRVDLLLDVDAFAVRGRGADRFAGLALACVSGRPHNHARALLKRAQDIVLASLLLALLALPMLAIAVAVKLDSRGPALYRQRRHGFNNRAIELYRFRSMRHDLRHEPDESRVTEIGAFLRSTSLDELPQLFNVLKGDLSMVGPRPHAIGIRAAELELQDIVDEYAHRHRVKPGMTGWAQVNGLRGQIDSAADARRRLCYDLEYVARASLWFDLQILLRSAAMLLCDATSRADRRAQTAAATDPELVIPLSGT